MFKAAIIGDVHGDWPALNVLVARILRDHPEVTHLFQVGDFGDGWPGCKRLKWSKAFFEELPTVPFHWCCGNHDNHDRLHENGSGKSKNPLIIYQERGTILTLDDLAPEDTSIMFFGGATSIDKEMRTEGASWWPEESIRYAEMRRALQHIGPIKAVVSHDCPVSFNFWGSGEKFEIGKSDRQALDALLMHVCPEVWFFGHYHEPARGTSNGTSWVCCPSVTTMQYVLWDGDGIWCSWE
jgi:hypothetical protein